MKAALGRGWSLAKGPFHQAFKVDGELVLVSLSEQTTRSERQPDESHGRSARRPQRQAGWAAVAVRAVATKAQRDVAERRRQEQEEEERRRQERRRAEALEKKRVEAFTKTFELWERHERISAFIAAVEARLATGDPENRQAVEEWLAWAKGYAARLDLLGDGPPTLLHESGVNSRELT